MLGNGSAPIADSVHEQLAIARAGVKHLQDALALVLELGQAPGTPDRERSSSASYLDALADASLAHAGAADFAELVEIAGLAQSTTVIESSAEAAVMRLHRAGHLHRLHRSRVRGMLGTADGVQAAKAVLKALEAEAAELEERERLKAKRLAEEAAELEERERLKANRLEEERRPARQVLALLDSVTTVVDGRKGGAVYDRLVQRMVEAVDELSALRATASRPGQSRTVAAAAASPADVAAHCNRSVMLWMALDQYPPFRLEDAMLKVPLDAEGLRQRIHRCGWLARQPGLVSVVAELEAEGVSIVNWSATSGGTKTVGGIVAPDEGDCVRAKCVRALSRKLHFTGAGTFNAMYFTGPRGAGKSNAILVAGIAAAVEAYVRGHLAHAVIVERPPGVLPTSGARRAAFVAVASNADTTSTVEPGTPPPDDSAGNAVIARFCASPQLMIGRALARITESPGDEDAYIDVLARHIRLRSAFHFDGMPTDVPDSRPPRVRRDRSRSVSKQDVPPHLADVTPLSERPPSVVLCLDEAQDYFLDGGVYERFAGGIVRLMDSGAWGRSLVVTGSSVFLSRLLSASVADRDVLKRAKFDPILMHALRDLNSTKLKRKDSMAPIPPQRCLDFVRLSAEQQDENMKAVVAELESLGEHRARAEAAQLAQHCGGNPRVILDVAAGFGADASLAAIQSAAKGAAAMMFSESVARTIVGNPWAGPLLKAIAYGLVGSGAAGRKAAWGTRRWAMSAYDDAADDFGAVTEVQSTTADLPSIIQIGVQQARRFMDESGDDFKRFHAIISELLEDPAHLTAQCLSLSETGCLPWLQDDLSIVLSEAPAGWDAVIVQWAFGDGLTGDELLALAFPDLAPFVRTFERLLVAEALAAGIPDLAEAAHKRFGSSEDGVALVEELRRVFGVLGGDVQDRWLGHRARWEQAAVPGLLLWGQGKGDNFAVSADPPPLEELTLYSEELDSAKSDILMAFVATVPATGAGDSSTRTAVILRVQSRSLGTPAGSARGQKPTISGPKAARILEEMDERFVTPRPAARYDGATWEHLDDATASGLSTLLDSEALAGCRDVLVVNCLASTKEVTSMKPGGNELVSMRELRGEELDKAAAGKADRVRVIRLAMDVRVLGPRLSDAMKKAARKLRVPWAEHVSDDCATDAR